jgi:predicted ATPase
MGARPTGTVTFLFTDIEGSTEKWEADSDLMRVQLAEHDDVLRSVTEERGGWLFKHTGDGVCVAFADPEDAVECAIEAQRRLGLPVRMGISTGVAEQRDDDYFGPVMNRVSRVMSAGHGGQVLIADATVGLVSGVDFVDLGDHRLRGLSDPVHIFQVAATGLATEFGALRSLDSVPGNLPVPVNRFCGRERERAEVGEVVRAHRLVTLTGVGGVGKTRLALQVSADLTAEFPGGVWLVELAEVGDPAAVPDAVVAALGITPQPAMSITESIVQGLSSRKALMILDNCEHLLDAAGDLVEAMLGSSDRVHVLVTSREGTGAAGERLWPVPSLDVRSGAASDAFDLFVDRAQAIEASFSVADVEEEAAIVEICERLDGIALAIELAAARVASMTPLEIRERLGDRFRLLSGGRRGLERHQTLQHTVQWSYDLLGDDERALLRRCAVFTGGFDLSAAVAVVGGSDVDDYRLLDDLDTLVRKSLLIAHREGGRSRYSMLETIRQFADDRLVDTGEHLEVRARHARFFADRVVSNFEQWAGPDQRQAYSWLEVNSANLRAAFRWALTHGHLDSAATIAGIAAYPAAYSLWFEPAEWCVELLGSSNFDHHHLRRWCHMGAAQLTFVGSPKRALSHAEAGLALRDDHLEPVPHELERSSLGIAMMFDGDVARWVSLARDISTSTRDDLVMGASSLVWMLALTGEHDEATARIDDVLERATATGCPMSVAYAHAAAGLALSPSDAPRALQSLETAAQIANASGNRMFEAVYRREIARIEATGVDPLNSLESLDRIIGSFHRIGDTANLVPTLGYLVLAMMRLQRLDSAANLYGAVTRFPAAAMVPELDAVGTELRNQLGPEQLEQRLAASNGWDITRTVEAARSAIRAALAEAQQRFRSDEVAARNRG